MSHRSHPRPVRRLTENSRFILSGAAF
jgi:hypothetical protein